MPLRDLLSILIGINYCFKFFRNCRTWVLRPFIKHPVSLFILLLIGYSQVFAHLDRGYISYSPIKKINGSERCEALVIKTTEIEDIYIEKEVEERISLKEYSKDNTYSAFFYNHLKGYFFQHINAYLCRDFSVSFFRLPYLAFRVFRLWLWTWWGKVAITHHLFFFTVRFW